MKALRLDNVGTLALGLQFSCLQTVIAVSHSSSLSSALASSHLLI